MYIYLLLILIINGCSISNNTYPKIHQELKNIKLESINSIEGATLYKYLSRKLQGEEEEKYALEVILDFSDSASAISPEGIVFYKLKEVRAIINLKDIDNKIIFSDKVEINSSYDNKGEALNSYLNSINITEKLCQEMAEKIYNRLIKFFAQRNFNDL